MRRAAILLIAICRGSAPDVLAQSAVTDWTIDSSASRLTIHVLPAGLLASALHAHRFQPENWGGEIRWDPRDPEHVELQVRIAADSLRDHEEKLSASDVAKVEAQTRSARVLDVAKFPSIRFEGRELSSASVSDDGQVRATLTGDLTLHGHTRPLRFPLEGRVRADRIEARAAVKFKQSDFGIRPYSTALGSIAVRDEIAIDVSLVAMPRAGSPREEGAPAEAARP